VVYRGLERPHLLHLLRDELYELDDEGLAFIAEVEEARPAGKIKNRELFEFAESEGLLEFSDEPEPRKLGRGQSPVPSLRYLELILTYRCNLHCRHCYQGGSRNQDLDPGLLEDLLVEFDQMQGLRLLLSGGEPLLYPHRDRLIPALACRGYRVVLITNGHLLDHEALADLPLHEVQVSLDGMERGHDSLRGEGSFRRALSAARRVRERGLDLSVATMIHSENLAEMGELKRLVRELEAREWSLEVPTPAGKQGQAEINLDRAAELMARGFGGSYHGSAEGFACGHHLAAVLPGGRLAKCGFYEDRPLADLKNGLRGAWLKKPALRVSELPFCRDCAAALECGGGCRFRAGGDGPDPIMCAAYGWPKGEVGFGEG